VPLFNLTEKEADVRQRKSQSLGVGQRFGSDGSGIGEGLDADAVA
jgi:hypothetical protein